MPINPAFLIECTLYEKCLKQFNDGDYLSEFQRVFPNLFNGPFTITPEIDDLENHRKKLAHELNEVPKDSERYSDIEDAIWYTYQYEVNAFYEANKPKLDEIIDSYQQFLSADDKKEELIFKIVHTPAGYWLATRHQSWLLVRSPFTLRYTCKALGVYLYRWIKSMWKGWRLGWKRRKTRGGIWRINPHRQVSTQSYQELLPVIQKAPQPAQKIEF
jgi:hypothetical protein